MLIGNLKNDARMPKHIAIIIDGNGRWAIKRHLTRSEGHVEGAKNLSTQIEFVKELGIKNLSIYAFSAENWKRPKQEVDLLMDIFDKKMDEYKEKYLNEDVRVIVSGNLEDERLPISVRKKAVELMNLTKNKTGFVVNLCINYGGRQEILQAVNKIIETGDKLIDEHKFNQYLYTADLLPLDLIIRTSGEQRLSNFMPWQSTYSEFYFCKTFWPAFSKKHLIKTLKTYMKRNRRFGAV